MLCFVSEEWESLIDILPIPQCTSSEDEGDTLIDKWICYHIFAHETFQVEGLCEGPA